MPTLTQQLIEQLIKKNAVLPNYPKEGIDFLALNSLFSDSVSRKLISHLVHSYCNALSFNAVAALASRGYLYSGMLVNDSTNIGELLIEKAKNTTDSHFIRIDSHTEYSSNTTLQVHKDSVESGKKYLITDDLAATGGSIIAAVELIRTRGGIVDTAFVVTELVDQEARKRLEALGVHLISVLKFTAVDLKLLINLQEIYTQNPTIPITYQLSHHTSNNNNQFEDETFEISRQFHLSNQSKHKYAKSKVVFTRTPEHMGSPPIDIYNHGCPTDKWGVDEDKISRNDFKVFTATGDIFSVISPVVAVRSSDINIHVGLEHKSYNPLVLIHEALQLCRTVSEHGAHKITIALPEQLHPLLHPNDFNVLLLNLFKASGASKLYYYNDQYRGNLTEPMTRCTMRVVLSDAEPSTPYHISRGKLLDYLHLSSEAQLDSSQLELDSQVEHFTRREFLKSAWDILDSRKDNMIASLCRNAPDELQVPPLQLKPHILLSCSSNRALAEKIAASLKDRGEYVIHYAINGEGENALIPDEAALCGAVVTIVQSTRPNPDNIEDVNKYLINGASNYFFETAMIARQAHLRGAQEINLVNPYQFSARSDKAEDDPIKGKTGAYVQLNGRLLEEAGVNHVITAECHDAHTLSGSYTGTSIKGTALPALTIIATHIAKQWVATPRGHLRLVTPDAGATKRTKALTTELQVILGTLLSQSRILGEKQRDTHKDDSAVINSLNSGEEEINDQDTYLITDDETATGTTLCQAILKLREKGAKNIVVAVIHNNMPLDWLTRQLCLARFLHFGVSELHFSDTQEMGTLAESYDDLIAHYAQLTHTDCAAIESKVIQWFSENIKLPKGSVIEEEFARFKVAFSDLKTKVKVHTLAEEFANQVQIDHRFELVTEKTTSQEHTGAGSNRSGMFYHTLVSNGGRQPTPSTQLTF